MPLLCSQNENQLIWHLRKSKFYSVKSAYYGVLENLVNIGNLKVQGDWVSVWQLKVTPKVKLLTWRLLREVLPTKVRLNRKGVNCPIFYQFCEHGEENDCHIFVGCDIAMKVWEVVGLDYFITLNIQHHGHTRMILLCFYGVYGREEMTRFGWVGR